MWFGHWSGSRSLLISRSCATCWWRRPAPRGRPPGSWLSAPWADPSWEAASSPCCCRSRCRGTRTPLLASSLRSVRELAGSSRWPAMCSWWRRRELALASAYLGLGWGVVCRAACIFIAGAFRHVVVALGERRWKRAFFFVTCLFIHFLGPGNKVAGLFWAMWFSLWVSVASGSGSSRAASLDFSPSQHSFPRPHLSRVGVTRSICEGTENRIREGLASCPQSLMANRN